LILHDEKGSAWGPGGFGVTGLGGGEVDEMLDWLTVYRCIKSAAQFRNDFSYLFDSFD
jgi:hypothetical protein